MQADTLIIGAGLSGLAAGLRLQAAGRDFLIVEARERVGGRAHGVVLGEGGIDLGPSWVWPAYQPRVRTLIEALGLRHHAQFETGQILYDAVGGVQRLAHPVRYGDARRIAGGPAALAEAMAAKLPADRIQLGATVTALDFTGTPTATLDGGKAVTAHQVIAAVPPRLLASWAVVPDLPAPLKAGLTRWPTWMAAHAKFVARYERPFWREAGLSGSALSQRGPLMEVVDHSDEEAGIHALFGFVGWPAQQRKQRGETGLISDVLGQLVRLYGEAARNPLQTHFKDWTTDPFTAGSGDEIAPNGHPLYGEPALQELWFDDRLVIAGAEADTQHGGLIEGALRAADVAVERLNLTTKGHKTDMDSHLS